MPSSLHTTHAMLTLFRQELELCQVTAGQKVVVLSEAEQAADYAAAFLIAARELGADVFNLNLPSGRSLNLGAKASEVGTNALSGNRAAIDALKSADLVVDLIFLLFSKEQLEIQAAGTRILLVAEPFEVLSRLFPTPQLRERVEAGEARLAKAQQLRFTNPAGTDVSYRLGQYPVLTEYGFTDTPGRWDHWPGGFLATQGAEAGVDGKVVMAQGDILFPFNRYVQEPIVFTIREGMIVNIAGGFDRHAGPGLHGRFSRSQGVRRFPHRLGLERAGPLGLSGQRRAHAGHGRSVVLRQRPVLDRPEYRAGRYERHSLSHGPADEGLQPVSGR